MRNQKNSGFKNKFNIGIDLDDVVFEFVNTLIKNYRIKHSKNINYEDVFTYHFSKVFNHTDENMNKIIDNIFDNEKIRNMDLCDNAYESIKELSEENNLYFITSRFNNIEATLESLDKNFRGLYSETIFSSNPYVKTPGKSKGEICEEYKIDFMIEDSKEHAIDCAERGTTTFLLEKPWNKEHTKHNNIIKVKNWKEVLDNIHKNGY